MSSSSSPKLFGGIEAGGTKYVCAVAHDPAEPLLETRFPTQDPATTLTEASEFFREAEVTYGPIDKIGIGTFGPADVNPHSPGYGEILTTPKKGWQGFNVVAAIRDGIGRPLPVAFENDANAAAIGEHEHGAARGLRNVCYITIGTGIGGGFLHGGQPLHGRMHPEIGHMIVPDLDKDFEKATNVCPFHHSCLEGRASGPAIEARWGKPGSELPTDHPAWTLQAKYLAIAAVNLTASWSPDIILVGGGVAQQPSLIDRVRSEFSALAGDYWNLPPLDRYLQTPALDQQAGIVGALALAAQQEQS